MTSTPMDEVADGIYRLSSCVADVGPPGFTFNPLLIDDDEPLLFHTGQRMLFDSVSEAVATIVPIETLRWITFGHIEADECGSMNQFLAAAPRAEIAHGALGCMVSLNDLADRPPVPLANGQVLELGTHRVRHIDTPHVPHGWEARVLFEETTRTLLCGDLFTQLGQGPALTSNDVLEAAAQAEDVFGASCLTPSTAPTIRSLADLEPSVLAVMHGSSVSADCAGALQGLADDYERRLLSAVAD